MEVRGTGKRRTKEREMKDCEVIRGSGSEENCGEIKLARGKGAHIETRSLREKRNRTTELPAIAIGSNRALLREVAPPNTGVAGLKTHKR